MSDIMIDIETLSCQPEAVILTLGAIKFDPYNYEEEPHTGLYLRLNVNEQLKMGRHVEDATVAWWGEQAKDVQDEALGDENRTDVNDVLDQLNKYQVGSNNIWAQGTYFDITMLENLYKQLQRPAPWNYWQICDSRTLFKVHGDPRQKGRQGLHNALADCYYQARAVQEVYKNLGLKKQ